MDAAILTRLFGRDQQWHGPCTVILGAEATVQTVGGDSIASAGAKVYAPRVISGRVAADAVCLLYDASALLILQQQRVRQATGEEFVKQTLTVADVGSIAAIEFFDTAPLANLGVPAPVIRTSSGQSGVMSRPPKVS
ncbi:MAG: hypothetical protein NZ700_10070 [Gemmataceae bacterium]|nr:hypothetical protein [Gemmataceae bacterium]MDW8264027.1 hypothetical protein [Gemmataceae bacterium]